MTLKEHKFHSRTLLPKGVTDKGEDAVSLFEEEQRSLYRFSEGESVVHVENHSQTMIVQEIVRKESEVRGQQRKRLDGIICHWWE